ncbi:hypothetical protein Droror1_Dr00000595 [Drosera rotundifolia]
MFSPTSGELVKNKNQKENSEIDSSIYVRGHNTYHPKRFGGDGDPATLEDWIRNLEKLFNVVQCPETLRVNFAVYYLEGEASAWWSTIEERAKEPTFNGESFKKLIRERFYPVSLQVLKRDEFLAIKQGNMTVPEYATQFTTLLRFATSFFSQGCREAAPVPEGTWLKVA